MRLRLVGDCVVTTPAIRALRRRFPDARIEDVAEASAAPVVRHNPHPNAVIERDRPRGWRRVTDDTSMARQLPTAQFDIASDFHGGLRSAWLIGTSAAPTRIGDDIPGRRWACTTLVPWHPSLVPPGHSVRNQWDLVPPLEIGQPDPTTDAVEMRPRPNMAGRADARLAASGVPHDAEIGVLHVRASNPFRRWPRAAFADVAAQVASARPRRRIIITAGPSESDAARAIASDALRQAGPRAGEILCDDVSSEELSVDVSRAALFIGGDSGPMHIAATSPVPTVALFGPTIPARSMPWRSPDLRAVALEPETLPCRPCHQRTSVPGDYRCLTSIHPAAVIAAAEQLLEHSS